MTILWPRERLVLGGGPVRIAIIALTNVALPDPLPISRTRHGLPDSDSAKAVALSTRNRAEHPTWFEGFTASSYAASIAEDLGPDVAAACAAAQFAYVIEGDLDEALDLGHIQAAWALAKCVAEEAGPAAIAVIDIFAGRAWAASEVAALAAERPFDILHEISIILGVDETPIEPGSAPRGDDDHLACTRGMVKLGRGDLIISGIRRQDAAGAALLLRELAGAAAEGDLLEHGDVVELDDGAIKYDVVVASLPLVSAVELEPGALLLTRSPTTA